MMTDINALCIEALLEMHENFAITFVIGDGRIIEVHNEKKIKKET